MALAIRTPDDCPHTVEIGGVGEVGAFGLLPIGLDRLARGVRELQDDGAKPLAGAALRSAAERWAGDRGMEVADVDVPEYDADVRVLATESDPAKAAQVEGAVEAVAASAERATDQAEAGSEAEENTTAAGKAAGKSKEKS